MQKLKSLLDIIHRFRNTEDMSHEDAFLAGLSLGNLDQAQNKLFEILSQIKQSDCSSPTNYLKKRL